MIDVAIRHIATEINTHLKKLFYVNDNVIVIANIGENPRAVLAANPNKLVISLINIGEDKTPTRASQARQAGAYKSGDGTPPLCLNLQVLLCANFDASNYQKGLKFITYAVTLFQKHSTFTHEDCQILRGEIDQLIVELQDLDVHEWNSVWGMLGCNSMPSVMFRARMLAYDETDSEGYLAL